MDLKNNRLDIHKSDTEPWKITLIDTGMHTMTGGRLKRVKEYIGNERFLMTYGDGLSNIDINSEIDFHDKSGSMATIAAVQPSARFGALDISEKSIVKSFIEKPAGNTSWINAGFFVLEPGVIDYIRDDQTSWEREPLETIAAQNKLSAYRHEGFWKPMDTLRDKRELESLWESGKAPWKVW
jgi:glucose-1-phosphate cytidylyltransferase